jgi:hypothetical protein
MLEHKFAFHNFFFEEKTEKEKLWKFFRVYGEIFPYVWENLEEIGCLVNNKEQFYLK